MRIGMVVHTLESFGGLEEIVVRLAVSLRRLGHPTAVLSTAWVRPDNQYKQYLEANGVPLIQWPVMLLARPLARTLAGMPTLVQTRSQSRATAAVRRWESWAHADLGWAYLTSKHHVAWNRRLLTLFRSVWRPDLIHVHSYVYELNLTHVLEWTHPRRVPTVFEEHQTPDPARNVWGDFRRRINRATMVGAVSRAAAAILRDDLGVERPITVLPPLVPDPAAPAGEHGVPEVSTGPLTITTIARLIPAKGLPHLFEAIAKVRETHPAIHLLVYGDGPPRRRTEARASAEQFGFDPERVFAGIYRRHELSAILQAADIFVLSSVSEGLPITVIEAMACGRPIVATTVGGVPDLLEDGVTGLLCPPGDAASLARALCRLIENPEERASLGRAARAAYEQGPFHPDRAVRDYITMYEATMRIAREQP